MTYTRVRTDYPRTDPFSGLYLGAFGSVGAQALQLQRFTWEVRARRRSCRISQGAGWSESVGVPRVSPWTRCRGGSGAVRPASVYGCRQLGATLGPVLGCFSELLSGQAS